MRVKLSLPRHLTIIRSVPMVTACVLVYPCVMLVSMVCVCTCVCLCLMRFVRVWLVRVSMRVLMFNKTAMFYFWSCLKVVFPDDTRWLLAYNHPKHGMCIYLLIGGIRWWSSSQLDLLGTRRVMLLYYLVFLPETLSHRKLFYSLWAKDGVDLLLMYLLNTPHWCSCWIFFTDVHDQTSWCGCELNSWGEYKLVQLLIVTDITLALCSLEFEFIFDIVSLIYGAVWD